MSILDIDNNICDNTFLIMDWLKHNVINFDDYKSNDIEIVNNIINVKREVAIRRYIGNLPEFIKFGSVDGYFHCNSCKLTTLRGMPDYVKGNFDCSFNHLKSFEGGPKYVGGVYYADYNRLISLKGLPKYLYHIYLNACPDLLTLEDLKYVKINAINIRCCKQVSGAKYINHIDKISIQDAEILEQELILMNKKYNKLRKIIQRNYKIL